MKKQFTIFFSALVALVVTLGSCRKEINTPPGDEVGGTPPRGLTTYCRIESLWENPHQPDQRFFLVLYDEFENPTAVTAPMPSTGHPYRTFKYEQWHRMREYRGEYGNGFFEFWHFYGYDNNGRIGVDTNYVFGTLGNNGPEDYFDRSISHYEYDAQGRIIKVTTTSMRGDNSMHTYTYDAAGNLVYPASMGVTYDNKMNLNRTNDIWQFLNRDYSMNNPFIADEYNSANLPTIINTSTSVPSMLWLNEVDLRHSQIGYGCRQSYW